MSDTLRTYSKSVECTTMGHAGCTKTYATSNGQSRVISINHRVYGKLITEKPN